MALLGFLAGVEGLEVGGGELARDPPDVEVHVAWGRGQVNLDSDDVEPDKEATDLNARQVGEGAIAEHPGDAGLKVGEVLKVDVAGASQVHYEAAVGGKREGGDGGGEDSRGQAVQREDLGKGQVLVRWWRRREGRGGRGRRILCRRRGWGLAASRAGGEEEDGGEEEEEESERRHWWDRGEGGLAEWAAATTQTRSK